MPCILSREAQDLGWGRNPIWPISLSATARQTHGTITSQPLKGLRKKLHRELGFLGTERQNAAKTNSGHIPGSFYGQVHLHCKRIQRLPHHLRVLSLTKYLSYRETYCRARSCHDQNKKDEWRWTRSSRSSAILKCSVPLQRSSPVPKATTPQTGSEKEKTATKLYMNNVSSRQSYLKEQQANCPCCSAINSTLQSSR